MGSVPTEVVASCGIVFYAALMMLRWFGRKIHGTAPADERTGLESSLEDWKP